MKMNRISLHRLCLALTAVGALSFACLGHALQPAPDDSTLPDTLRRDYVAPINGPADDEAYAHGALGLIRPGFGRASLYVAWRVMHLPVGAVAQESHRRQGDWLHGAPRSAADDGERIVHRHHHAGRTHSDDEIATWLNARNALMPQPPAVSPDYFRHGKLAVPGIGDIETVTGQCGAGAYVLAANTLSELVADTSIKDADRQAWILGQDAVFARCVWVPGQTPAPALPAPLPKRAPDKLKALNAYQHAAALFYSDDFVAARKEFDAIAAVPEHPMRTWATLGALRAVVRDAVHDPEWEAAVADAWTKRQLRGGAFKTAVAEPAASHNARVGAAVKDIEKRLNAATADATLTPVHEAIKYTVRRAALQLAPIVPLRQAMDVLDHANQNPYVMATLDLFQDMYPRVAPDRPEGGLAIFLRQHAWFDFVATVQACNDAKNPDTAACDGEHAHALTRWQETKDNAWLLAVLMTARQPSSTDLPTAEAALAVATDRPEWASLQFYAARVLHSQGHGADARVAMNAVAASALVHKRDQALIDTERRAL